MIPGPKKGSKWIKVEDVPIVIEAATAPNPRNPYSNMTQERRDVSMRDLTRRICSIDVMEALRWGRRVHVRSGIIKHDARDLV